jgi:hypothetical protein
VPDGAFVTTATIGTGVGRPSFLLVRWRPAVAVLGFSVRLTVFTLVLELTGDVTMLAGHQQEIQAERDRKLEAAREQRKNRRQRAA